MPIIVGRSVRGETPVFRATLRYVEFSPSWNVPPSIARKEIVPAIERDPRYLQRERMDLVSADGGVVGEVADASALAALRAGRLAVRQRPGPGNALGGVKFAMPNAMDIYLHATPAQALFGRARRDFSHGCIRVADPQALAGFVLRDQPAWTAARIASAMSSGVTTTVRLREPLPVLVLYMTALADGEGRALFLPDLYLQDPMLERALAVHRDVPREAADYQ